MLGAEIADPLGLDEKLLQAQYGGALLIVLGVLLSQWKGKAAKPTEQQA